MAEIEEVSKPLTKMKNKKVLLFAGLGLVAGVVVLAFRGAGGGSASAPVADVIGGDQAVDALGSQMQAFAQQMGESQGELTQQMGESQTELNSQMTAFQADVNTNQASIVSQLVELQKSQAIPEPVAPVVAVPVRAPNKIVYGPTVDLNNARNILGNTGYSYVDTTNIKADNLQFNENSLIVGGSKAGGGVGDVNLNGARRLFGDDRYATAAEIANYKANL